MKITTLTLADLRLKVDDGDFFSGSLLPITHQRLLSQINNPRAEHDDVLLLVAHEGENVIGFLGVLPDTYRSGDGQRRFGWISGWWVEPDTAKSGAGAILLMKALALWQGRLAVAGFTESARRVYEGCGRFQPVIENSGLTIDLLLDKDVLCRRLPLLKRFGPLPKLISRAVALMQRLRCAHWRRFGRHGAGHQVRNPEGIDDSVVSFLDAHGRNEVLWRSAAEIEWMTSMPWVVAQPRCDVGTSSYPFSDSVRSFSAQRFEVRDASDHLCAFFVAMLRDGELKLPIAVFADDEAEGMAEIIFDVMIEVGAHRLTTYHPGLVREFSETRWPVLVKRPAQRLLVFSKKLDDVDFSSLTFSDGEGDGGFT